jgi:hypothetical protein
MITNTQLYALMEWAKREAVFQAASLIDNPSAPNFGLSATDAERRMLRAFGFKKDENCQIVPDGSLPQQQATGTVTAGGISIARRKPGRKPGGKITLRLCGRRLS